MEWPRPKVKIKSSGQRQGVIRTEAYFALTGWQATECPLPANLTRHEGCELRVPQVGWRRRGRVLSLELM